MLLSSEVRQKVGIALQCEVVQLCFIKHGLYSSLAPVYLCQWQPCVHEIEVKVQASPNKGDMLGQQC